MEKLREIMLFVLGDVKRMVILLDGENLFLLMCLFGTDTLMHGNYI
jgi:hypothetical protein